MSLQERAYQTAMLEEARGLIRAGRRSLLLQLPTGGGKTVLAATMFGNVTRKGKQSFFVVHRRELIRQSAETFDLVGIPFGYCAAGMPLDRLQPVQLASIGTLMRRVERMPKPAVIVWDEAHHLAAKSWDSVYNAFPDALHIGLSATPERLDGTGLRRWFGDMVRGPSTRELIEAGYLAPYRIFAPKGADLTKLHSRMGDFVVAEAEAAMDTPTITGDAVAHYARHAPGRRAVAFCVSIKHSIHVADQFRAAGFKAAHLDGDCAMGERDTTIDAFRKGEIEVLCNVDLFGEGFDLPALEVAILLRPTQSLAMYLQQVGRALRTNPGKAEALILDHAGNSARHGLPDDERTWTLDGRREIGRKSDDEAIAVKTCPKCFASVRAIAPQCPHCKYVFVAKPREVAQVEGDLVEVDKALARDMQLRDQGMAKTEADLVRIGTLRKMKRPELWARHVLMARAAKAARKRAA